MNTSAISSTTPNLLVSNRSFEDFRQALRIGQVMNGRVVRTFNEEKILIRLMGFTVVAKSAVPLRRGERVTVSVKDLTPMIHLKLAPAQTPSGNEQPDYTMILQRWGMDSEPMSLMLLAQMYLYRLPLKKRQYSRLKDLVKKYENETPGEDEEDLTRAAAMLKALGLPLDREHLGTVLESQRQNDHYDPIDYTV